MLSSELTNLLRAAFDGGASDLFLAEDQPPRLRIDGEVVESGGPVLVRAALEELWRACGLDPASDLDGDASLEVASGERLRVNGYRTLGRLAAVLRPIKREVPSFEELGLPGGLLTRWMGRRSGLVLVTGPTGSGKSTTVAACLEWINQHLTRHVVTIEDPIEYLFQNRRAYFSQREIHRDTGEFDTAIRQALRQNPDVIFVGEIRDTASALSALRAAETGHLVVSTLHGAGASGVPVLLERLGRIVGNEAGTASLLGQQLIGILSQRLLPRVGGGVTAILEYFENVAITRKWIAEDRFAELRDHIDGADGSLARPFLAHLVEATRDGRIDADTARASCERPRDFDRALRGFS